tara:strand:- start:560 stop:907 length:348 start_codon:yes stop_codon:yes gene_type:complete
MQMTHKIIALALVMVLVNLVSPWWGFSLLALSSAWVCNNLKKTMLISAGASVLSWVPLLIYSYLNGGDILFDRVSQMMRLPYPFILILSSGILAALLGVLAGLSGYYIKEVFDDN